jgi:thiamine biosynthesis protein ThiS
MITVQINGEKENVENEISIKSLLLNRNINPNIVACELNLKVIRRAELDNVKLKEGDVLEVIRMIGGG